MTKLILFDVGNVLICCNQQITIKKLNEYNVDENKANQFFQLKEYKQFSAGELSEQKYCNAIRTKLQCSLSNKILRECHDAHLVEVNQETINALKILSNKHQIGLATNTNKWQTEREQTILNSTGLYEIIKYDFRSHIMNALKPNKTFYQKILKETKMEPSEILLIDDSKENISGAIENGIMGYLFTNANQMIKDLSDKKTARRTTLK